MSAEIVFIPGPIAMLASYVFQVASGTACKMATSQSQIMQKERQILSTAFTDADLLYEALKENGYSIRIFENGINAKQGSIELDFLLDESNAYTMIVPTKADSKNIMENLVESYKIACQKKMHKHVVETLKKKGYQLVKEKTDTNGNIVLTLRNWK